MSEEEYLSILLKAWDNVLYHYKKFGDWDGYLHRREEDLRSLLFSKIFELFEDEKIPLLNIQTETRLPRKRLDIALGEREPFSIGIEIKRNKSVFDLGKLEEFMNQEKIKYGAFIAIVRLLDDMQNKIPFESSPYYLEIKNKYDITKDREQSNNFIIVTTIDKSDSEQHINWDALLIILRNIPKKI